jgi:hypothetical protein
MSSIYPGGPKYDVGKATNSYWQRYRKNTFEIIQKSINNKKENYIFIPMPSKTIGGSFGSEHNNLRHSGYKFGSKYNTHGPIGYVKKIKQIKEEINRKNEKNNYTVTNINSILKNSMQEIFGLIAEKFSNKEFNADDLMKLMKENH